MENDVLRWLWLLAAVFFAAVEASTVTFFVLPASLGCLAAFITSFITSSLAVQMIVAIAVSFGSLLVVIALRKPLERPGINDIGLAAFVGHTARVTRGIGQPEHVGMVQIGHDEWAADSLTGEPIAEGALVVVKEVSHNRLMVVLDHPGASGRPEPAPPS